MSLASIIEEWIAKLDGEAKVKITDLRPVLGEMEAKIRAAAAIAEPQIKADIEAAIKVAETSLESLVVLEA